MGASTHGQAVLAQVYLALAVLVEAGGGDAGKALAAADAEFAALAPDAKSKVCWDPACKAPVLLGCPAWPCICCADAPAT